MPSLTPPLDPLSSTISILNCRLSQTSNAPIALGLSGGGDSVALAHMAAVWAKTYNRALHFLTVDHQLNPDSDIWTQTCATLAARLGAHHHRLNWTGPKPIAGLPAAARQARHRLLAARAREIGAKVVLLGHTADDRAEGQSMRQAGSTVPDPRVWAPSPVWPEGRGIFILRPMLHLRRGDLRQWLIFRGETWNEDPSNQNPKFARARARATLDPLTNIGPQSSDDGALASLAAQARFTPILTLSRLHLRQAEPLAARVLTGMACLCVSGNTRPPRADNLSRLVDQLLGTGDVIATLAGARIEAAETQVRWMRNPGEFTRRKVGPMVLQAGVPAVWDGRYEIISTETATVVALQGHMSSLSDKARQYLRTLPVGARGALPLVVGEVCQSPVLEDVSRLQITDLTVDRFHAATGCVTSEPI